MGINVCIQLFITLVLMFILFQTTLFEVCKQKEDCSKQLPGGVCSLCAGETESSNCIYPFPELYIINKNTLECKKKDTSVCKTSKQCENGGICRLSYEESFICQCMSNYVGRHCEQKYDKIKSFFVFYIRFNISVAISHSTFVEIVVLISKDEHLNEVNILTGDSYYAIAGYNITNKYENCDISNCYRTYKGMVRYLYKPYNVKSTDFVYLGESVLGYFTKFQVDIVHKGTTIFNNKLKVFVSYPEKNICVPTIQLSECGVHHNNPTLYNRLSEIRISSSIKIIPNGNSRNPFGEKDKKLCDSESEINLHWNIWWLKTRAREPDLVVVGRFQEISIIINPLINPLEFGFYRVELEAKNVFSEGSSTNYAVGYFEIESLPLDAIIEGGTHRSVVKQDGLLLSAVNSRDPNQFLGDESIQAKWSCTALKTPEADVSAMCKPVTLKSNKPHLIPEYILLEGEFNFTLEIWSDLYQEIICRQCEMAKMHQFSYQIVEVSNKANLLIQCQINCGKTVNVNNELILKVSYLDNAEGISYQWSYMKVEHKEKIPLTPPDDLPSYIFQIPGDTLETATGYIVTVSVTLDGVQLSATYTFKTDDLNDTVNCSVNPSSGIRGITYFDIICSSSKRQAQIFEFYDATSEEARKRVFARGRMLGMSSKGELQTVILTRGTLVVYVKYLFQGYWYIFNKTCEVALTDHNIKRDALLYDILNSPLYLQKMPFPLLMQYISSLPDIITNDMDKKAFFDVLLQNLNPEKIKLTVDVKIYCLSLYNILSKLSRSNMDFVAVQKIRELILKNTNILKKSFYKNVMPINLKEIVIIILNILELSINVENETEVDSTRKDIFIETYLDLIRSSKHLEQILDDVKTFLSFLQKSGLRPTTVSSFNRTFVFNVLEEDTKHNYSLSKMLQRYSSIPGKISSVLMNQLKNTLIPEEHLSFCVAVVDKNIFKWFDSEVISNILIISLSKRTKENKIVNIREVSSSIDMEMHFNYSLPEVKEISQTIPLDPKLGEDSLDFQVRVHRFDPVPGSKLIVTFHYLPTNVTLRVLILEDRPTYKMMISHSSLITEKSPYYSPNYIRTETKAFYYMGVLPGPGIPLNQAVNFSFSVNSTTCMSWEILKWTSAGCKVGPNTSGHRIHCHCSHFSIFTAMFPMLPNQNDYFYNAKLFLSVWDNPLVTSIMVVIFVLYIILSILAYRMDTKDCFHGIITVLEDNWPGDSNPYLLAVYTSFRLFSGTSANVAVKLIGELSNSRAHILKCKYHNTLNRNSDDWFLIFCAKPLGFIKYLHLWHDNTGCSPGWYCNKVHVYDINSCLEWLFIVEQWIELNVTNYPEVLVVPASANDILRIKNVLNENISTSFREQRNITGIFTQHPRSTLRRIQRVNIFMCTLLIALLCSIMFYFDPKEVKPDVFTYNMKVRDLYISLLTTILIIVVSYVISLLFKKSYKYVPLKNNTSLCLRRSNFLEDYFDSGKHVLSNVLIYEPQELKNIGKTKGYRKRFFLMIKNIMKSQKLAPAVLPYATSGLQVRKIWLALTWATCTITIICCMYFIMLYGLKMGLVKSKIWLTSILISYINGKIFLGPLNVILLATAMTATLGITVTSSSYRVTEDDIKLSVSDIQSKFYKELIVKRQLPMYSPIKNNDRSKFLKKKIKFLYLIQVLRIFLSLCYIIIVVSTVHQIRYLQYIKNSHLKRMITSARFSRNSGGFYNAYDIEELKNYFVETFLEIILRSNWYNMRPLLHNGSSPYWTSDYSWKIVGVTYVRQLRVYGVPCHSFAPPMNICVPHWSFKTEDKDCYDIGWKSFLSAKIRKSSTMYVWNYTYPSANWLKTYYRLQGESGIIYSSGGYIAKIGSSIKKTVERAIYIADHKWIDMFTKVVFVELTLYNVNLNVLSQVTLLIELLTTGVSLKTARITSVVDCVELCFRHIAFIILTLIFFLDIFYQINCKGFTKFCRDIRNILLLLIVLPSIFVIIAYLIHAYDCSVNDMRDMYYVKKGDYFDFDTFMNFHSNIVLILSFFLLLGVVRTLLLLREQSIFLTIHNLFKLSLNNMFFLLSLTFIFFIFLQLICVHSEILTRVRIVNLVISQKRLKLLNREYFEYESAVLQFIKLCSLTLVSSFFITVFIQLYPTAHHLIRKQRIK